nr:hypothetical protein CFP56_22406 [Quercus suber]
MATITGCHLVGSVPLPDSAAVFRQCLAGLPARLRRIPDGETGARYNFTLWQAGVFAKSPALLTEFKNNAIISSREFTPAELDDAIETLTLDGPLETGYDTAALESYAVFKRLRDEGVVPAGTRFLVCIPTAANVLSPFVQFAAQARVEPIYEHALYRAIKNIQASIPHEDLSFQIDLAVDTAFWEEVEMYKPWFGGDVKSYVVDYVLRMIEQIDPDVELGLHNCYGDMEHRHWMEPTSLAAVVERGLRILAASPHPVAFFHCPVPRSALDTLDPYLAPLHDFYPTLKAQHGELVLGLVHPDRPTTQRMLDAAGRVVPEFAVASECGWGRTPPDQLADIMRISTEISQPVV